MRNDQALSEATAELGRQLAEWRKTHHAPTPIPAEMWNSAAELAAQQGISRTAQALRLHYNTLKRHVDSLAPKPARRRPAANPSAVSPAFVEWLAPVMAPNTIAECSVEVESVGGGSLRVEMKNLAPSGLATILRDFAAG